MKNKIEEIEVNNAEIMTAKKTKKISTTYTVQRYKKTIETLQEAKLITEEELITLKEIHAKMLQRWIALEMGI